HELTLALLTAIPFSFCTTARRLRSKAFLRQAPRLWLWRAGWLRRTPRKHSRFRLSNDMRRRWRSSKRRSRSIRTHSKDTTFMLGLVLPKANLSERRRFSSARQRLSPMTTNPSACSFRFIVPSVAMAKKSAARRGIERAERELTLHPDNPRPAYL